MPTVMNFTSLQQDLRVYLERGFTETSDPEVFNQLPRLINNAERAIATQLKVQGFVKNVVSFFVPGNDVYDKPDRWREWISVNYGTETILNVVGVQGLAAGARRITTDVPHGYAVGGRVVVSGVTDASFNTGTGSVVITAVTQLTVTYTNGGGVTAFVASSGLVSPPMEKREFLRTRSYEYCRAYWPNPTETDDPLFYADYDYYHVLVVPTPRRPNPFELNYYEQPPLLDDTNQTNWLTDLQPNLLLYRSLVEAAPFLKNEERLQTWQGLYAEQAQSITGQDLDKIKDRTSDRSKP